MSAFVLSVDRPEVRKAQLHLASDTQTSGCNPPASEAQPPLARACVGSTARLCPKPTGTAVAPQPHSDETQRSASQRGFTLLVVLSMLGLLAVVAASFAQMARNHV